MSAVYTHQTTFNRGELSPLLASRTDIDYWRSSTALCTNFLVLRQGGLRRRSGTIFIAEVKDSAKAVRLLPFVFNAAQAYVLELGDGYCRFYAGRGRIEDGSAYEIASPYGEADLFDIEQVQSADVMYIAHGDTPPQELRRNGDTDWAFAGVGFRDGPFLDNIRPARLTLSDTGHATPAKTSNGSGTGVASAQYNSTTAWRAFDRDKSFEYGTGSNNTIPCWIKYDFTAGNEKVINAYALSASDRDVATDTPSAWQVQASNDDVSWVTLDARQRETDWRSTETRNYQFENETAYRYYRINFTELNDDSSAHNVRIGESAMAENAEYADPITLTASAAAGINGDAGFEPGDVGRHIRVEDSDGQWRWFRITARTSATEVEGVLYGPPLNTDAPVSWRIGAFSAQSGYPNAVCFYQERLCWGGTREKPVSVWASKAGDLTDHGVSAPLVDDDAISVTMLSSQVNQIRWIAEDEDILIGSAGSIRTIGAADRTSAFSANNAEQRRHTTYGSAGVTPARAGNTTIFVGRAMRNLRELLYSPEANGYVAPDLSILSSHLFASGIRDMAWQQDPTPILWVATGDGDLIAVTYDREQRVAGFARHRIAGPSAGAGHAAVESVAVIPNAAGFDDLYMVVRRTIDGSERRYVEVLEREFDNGLAERQDGIFLDSCLTYSGPPVTSLTGLDHLEGESVGILADGAVLADQTVSGGAVMLPGGVSASTVHVGLRYLSRARTLPVAGAGRDGTLFGRRRKPTACFIDLMDTGDIRVGTAIGGTERPSDPEGGDAAWESAGGLKSGVWRCDMDGSWTLEGRGQVDIETDEPLPATVRSLMFQIEGEP
jgi:hypothetical protein